MHGGGFVSIIKEFPSLENDVCHARRCIGREWPWMKCVLNAKFTVFHMNFGKYLNFGTSENF